MGNPLASWQQTLCTLTEQPQTATELTPYFEANYAFRTDRSRILRRYRQLTDGFSSRCDSLEIFLARAPGRINLIGEHTDYNGLPVLPMAIDRDLAAIAAPRDNRTILLSNTDPAFQPRSFEIQESIPSYETGDWGNYCKAAVQGLLDHYCSRGKSLKRFRGFQGVINGDIPAAAGLSSSSAMVVLCALLLLRSNGLDLPKLELATLLARAEHYVGTQGGGMDQATSLLSQSGKALKIDFYPLRITPAPLPAGYSFVVADSLVKAVKTAGALDQYNRRPIECRLAVAILRKKFSEQFRREAPLSLLGDLSQEKLGISEAQIWELADRAFHPAPYSLGEIASLLGQSPEEIARAYCLRRDGTVFSEPADGFKLFQRYRHVIDEGRRVEKSLKALQESRIADLATLMNQSHQSCRDLYEISCPELDRLVDSCLEAGAEGSRLTGAGFGGCTISLVRMERLEAFLRRVTQAYYRDFLKVKTQDFSSIIFPCKAVNGAETLF